jgi:pimeloyl-ACP methyl ester carboxylesterase
MLLTTTIIFQFTVLVVALNLTMIPNMSVSFSDATLYSMESLATNVRGGIVPLSGHWIPEERPDFLVKQLAPFLPKPH